MAEISRVVLRAFIAVLLLVTLAFLTAVLVVIGSMPDLPKSNVIELCLPLTDTDDTVSCEPDQLQKYTLQKIETSYVRVGNKYKDEDATAVDKGVISLKQFLQNHRSDMRPSVRMVGEYGKPNLTDSKTHPNSLVPVRSWANRKHLVPSGGFRRFGVELRNGRVVVPISGIYEVYSYLQFREPCKDGKPERKTKESVRHSVFKFDVTTGEDRELMSDAQPHKVSKNIYTSIYDSYLVSLFKLRSGDEISVKVNDLGLLDLPEFNFFGAQFIEDIESQG